MDGFLTKILVATDGSEHAFLAARAAIDLSRALGSELHVVHVWTCVPSHCFSSHVAAGLEREAREILDTQVEKLGSAGGTVTRAHLREGRAADEIADLATELEADLVTMGRRGLGPIRRLAVGSVSEGVVQLAPCPVLIVGGGEEMWPSTSVIVGDESSEGAKRAGELAASVGRLFTAQVVLVRVHDSRRAAGVTRRAVEVRKAEEALEERAAELESILPDRPEERRRRRRLCALRAMERLGLLGEEDLIPTLARRPALRWLADEEGDRWVILTELGRIGEPGAFEVAVEWALENRTSPEEAKAYVCRFRSGATGLPEVAEARRNLSQESAVY